MITREISPKGRSVRVTFALPVDSATSSVAIAGSFNSWSETAHTMALDKRRGLWKKSISFKPGDRVEFRYLLDGSRWRTEEEAYGTAVTPYFSANSVLEL